MSLVGLTLTDTVAHAASYVVTTTADGGAGSLRDAIDQANADPGPDTIALPAGTYTITLAGANEDLNATGDFDILGDTTIIGEGAGATIIDAAGIDRAFELHSGATVLQGLTVTNGDVGSSFGGNIMERGDTDLRVQDSVISHGSALAGGGIYGSEGVLTVARSEIIDNAPLVLGTDSSGAAIYKGGGALGTLNIRDSLIAGNNSIAGGATLAVNANANITNSTFTANSANSGTIEVSLPGSNGVIAISLVHVTIAGNSTTNDFGGDALSVTAISPAAAVVTVEGSLFQNNTVLGVPFNCFSQQNGSIVSAGNNLTDDTSCTTFVQSSDQTNNALTTLGALADNGGPTRTMAVVAGSSAIDAAGNCGAVTPTDQRGLARPTGSACDVGAFEVGEVVPPTTSTTSTSTTSTSTTSTSTTSTIAPINAPTTTVDNGGVGFTSLPAAATIAPSDRDTLPVTGGHTTGVWLAMLACSLGGLLVHVARRRIAR